MRCFVAIDINNELCAKIGEIQSRLKKQVKNQDGIKWVKPDLIHLTLKFLGEVEEEKAEMINFAIEQVCAKNKSFELEFSTLGTFGRPVSVLWLGIEKQTAALDKLVQDIEQAFEELGFAKEQRPFSAHLTLARVKDGRLSRQLTEIIDSFGKINAGIVKPDSICFYKSQLTSAGPVYTLLRKINFGQI